MTAPALPGDVAVLASEPNPSTSTFPSEILTCRTPGGDSLRLHRKRAGGAGHDCFGHRGGVAYEARVYERVLAPLGCSVPAYFGSGVDGDGEAWLVVEHLDGADRLNRSPEPDALALAASWIGGLHAAAERRPIEAFLNRYDAAYYRGWAERTLRFVDDGECRYPWLAAVCAAFAEVADELAAAPATVIHGEFYPRNILSRGRSIHPIDWESAAVAPGEIDLAALTDGWDAGEVAAAHAAYAKARWSGSPPAGFERRLELARLYLLFRWLGDRPYWTNLEGSRWQFEALHACAARLGLIA